MGERAGKRTETRAQWNDRRWQIRLFWGGVEEKFLVSNKNLKSYRMEMRVSMKGVTDADRKNAAGDAESAGHVEQWREDVRRLLLVVAMSTSEALDCTDLNVANFANNG